MARSTSIGLLMLCLLGLAAGTMAQQSCRDGLDRQNMYRKNHGVGPLQWDDNLFRRAADAARQSASRGCDMNGINAAAWMCQGRNCDSCPSVADRWYWAFRDNFNFNTPNLYTDNQQKFGWWAAGSSMLWKDARRVGCAKASGSNCMVFACMYDTGNIVNDQAFRDNIFPEGGSRNSNNNNNNNNNRNSNNNNRNSNDVIFGSPTNEQCTQWRRQNQCDTARGNDVGQSRLVREWCPSQCRDVPLPSSGVGSGPSLEIPGKQCQQWLQQGKCARGRGNTWRDPSRDPRDPGATKEIAEWCWSTCRNANSNSQPQPNNNNNNNNRMQPMNNTPQPRAGDVLWYCDQWKANGWCLPGWTGQDLQGRTRPVLELCRATCGQPFFLP